MSSDLVSLILQEAVVPKPISELQKVNATTQTAVLSKIPPELLDHLMKAPMTPEAVQEAVEATLRAPGV